MGTRVWLGMAWQGKGRGAQPVWCWQHCRLSPPCLCRGASPPLGEQLAGGAWLSLLRPVGVSLGEADLALVQQTLWPRADGDGCGFPLSPPFLLAEAHGWGELCVAHCGRVSPLGITFWRGDPRRERLACGCLLQMQLLSTWRSSFTSRSCPGEWGSKFRAVCESYASPSALLLAGCMEEGMLWQCLEVGFALGSSLGRLWLGSLFLALALGREQAR